MIDLHQLHQYRENNQIEAKKALGGLPQSIWETYSAFANTLGGVILLGVEELPDKSFRCVDLPDPEALVTEFWQGLTDPLVVSSNILSQNHIRIHTLEGKRILVISVPQAKLRDYPVYLLGDPMEGTYRRSGDGDYRCTPEEVAAMLRDSVPPSIRAERSSEN